MRFSNLKKKKKESFKVRARTEAGSGLPAGAGLSRASGNKNATQRECNQYTRAKESVMRCSQACVVAVAVYLRRARRRSTLRRCPLTCSCPRARRRTASRSTRRASRSPETAAGPRPFPFPCPASAACTPAEQQCVRSTSVFSFSFFFFFFYCFEFSLAVLCTLIFFLNHCS